VNYVSDLAARLILRDDNGTVPNRGSGQVDDQLARNALVGLRAAGICRLVFSLHRAESIHGVRRRIGVNDVVMNRTRQEEVVERVPLLVCLS